MIRCLARLGEGVCGKRERERRGMEVSLMIICGVENEERF